jgi:hypothetical protein
MAEVGGRAKLIELMLKMVVILIEKKQWERLLL